MKVDAMGQTLEVGQVVLVPSAKVGNDSGLRFGVIKSIGEVRVVITPLADHPKRVRAPRNGTQRYFEDVLVVQL